MFPYFYGSDDILAFKGIIDTPKEMSLSVRVASLRQLIGENANRTEKKVAIYKNTKDTNGRVVTLAAVIKGIRDGARRQQHSGLIASFPCKRASVSLSKRRELLQRIAREVVSL